MLPDIKTILYATDLTGNSAQACAYAVYLAEKTGADVHVIHVAEKLPADALDTLETYLDKFDNRENFLNARIESAKKLLAKRFETFWNGVDSKERNLRRHVKSLHVVESQPAETIVEYADNISADLIVMGTHQKGPVQAFLGSISRRVLSTATVPTLVVPIGQD